MTLGWLLSQQLVFCWRCPCSRVYYGTTYQINELIQSVFFFFCQTMWPGLCFFFFLSSKWILTYELVSQPERMPFWPYWESLLCGSDHRRWLIALNLLSRERLLFLLYCKTQQNILTLSLKMFSLIILCISFTVSSGTSSSLYNMPHFWAPWCLVMFNKVWLLML